MNAMIQRIFPLVFFLLPALCLSCSEKEDLIHPGPCETPGIQEIIFGVNDFSSWTDDPLSLDTARVVGDTLHLALGYGGGCACHEIHALDYPYSCCIPDPNPVIRIFHDGNGDACEAWLHRDVSINLKPLRKEGVNEVPVLVLVQESTGLRFVSLSYVYSL